MTRLTLAALTAVVTCGCFGGSSAVSQTAASGVRTGTLSGLVALDGGVTVFDNGGIADLRTVRAAPVFVIGRTATGKAVALHATIDTRGRFRLRLPAGRYMVFARIFRSAVLQPHRRVVVRAGQAIRIQITGHVQ